MDIKIYQQPALIGLDIKQPAIKIKQIPSEIHRQSGKVKLDIKQEYGQVQVDGTRCREKIGFYDYDLFMKKIVREGYKTALEGIQRRVQEGFQMADVHENRGIVAKITAEKAWIKPGQIEVGFKPGPEITYRDGSLAFEPEIKPDKYDVSFYQVNVNLDWGKVNMYLRQKNYIDVKWTGNVLDFVR
ncbi:hypothetical protein BBF96_11170 [Anoxybacter fermentans]|uniref:Uncharacterized protein n=1 Tax=Anoxybacter fermentans TaxID=1323375 RepID=A0A3Q9HRU0_9FIRM|nr:DUF6470 family protein [Anoxybacter fermentans]AZR73900.1 hypothetical protein BBF96_11170 [Anoxybacter fermentans]